MFFLLSSFRFCPPLKNDGTSEWRFQKNFHLLCQKEKNRKRELSPLVGESVSEADERGKCEQKRKNKKISMSKTNKKYSDLCTQTCPYRLARLGTSLRIRGKRTTKEKAIKFLYSKNKNKEMTHTKKPSPLVGEGGGVSRRKGQV